MAQWYVKDLSKLTTVSVRTLHHYDRIGLLKPSLGQSNGYRLYTEADLLKLQQIIALKFFGFELSHIKTLLANHEDFRDHFSVQSQFLEEKAKTLLEASATLKSVISRCSENQSIPWETLIELIEVYRMTQHLEKTCWIGKVLNSNELKEYARFEQGLKTRYTEEEKKAFEDAWEDLIEEINGNLDKDPTSDLGVNLGKRCMDMINGLYGRKYAALRKTIWEKGFKAGNMDGEHSLSPQVVVWLDKAMDTYYRRRIYGILEQVDTHPSITVLELWKDLLDEMYGEEQAPKDALLQAAMTDDKISLAAKEWLKKWSNPQ